MSLCVCIAHCDVGYVWHNSTDKGEERDSISPLFFFRFEDLGSRAFVEMAGLRGMGMGWDDMRYDYDTRANYCIISAT
jgi:hypothetical protein